MENSASFNSRPAIYSPQVVLGFSAAFSALAGGVLTFMSLRAAGRSKAAWQALATSVVVLALSVGLIYYIPFKTSVLSVGLGFLGGTLLNELFLKKQLPDEADYPRRSIVVPLLVCLVLAAGLVYVLIHSMEQELNSGPVV